MRCLLRLLPLFVLYSCNTIIPDEIVNEDNIVYPVADKMDIKELLYVDKIGVYDSLICFINRNTEPIFYVYDEDFLYKGSFGMEGHGPYDFQFPFFLNTENQDGILPVYDVNSASFKSIDIEKALESKTEFLTTCKMPSYLIGSPNLTMMDDSCFIGNIDSGQGLFFVSQSRLGSVEWIEFPKILQRPKKDFTVMNMNRIVVNSQSREIISAMGYYNLLFLYDISGTLKKTIQIGEKRIEPIVLGEHYISEDNYICCREIVSSGKFVYVMMQIVKEKDFEKIDNAPSRILVFDWGLNYLKTYQLPHYSLTFDVDDLRNRIIYTAFNEEGGTDIYSMEL